MSEWCTIESDPGVFTALIHEIGVTGVVVEELYSLDQPLPDQTFGLIFLFKYVSEEKECLHEFDPDLFFANQVITNACATQAIINILMNSPIELGEELNNFKAFTTNMDSKTKGLVISNSNKIREVHNSFKKVEPFFFEEKKSGGKKEDAFHFVAYIPHKGVVYELDGLQPGPIRLASFDQSNWLDVAKEEIQQRIQKYAQNEIRFNLMAVIPNRKIEAEQNIQQLKSEKVSLLLNLKQINSSYNSQSELESLQGCVSLPCYEQQTEEYCLMRLKVLNNQLIQQQSIVFEQNHKQQQQQKENIRRKHDYTPFIIELLKKLAQKGQLENLLKNPRNL